MHKILTLLLKLNILNYSNVQPLLNYYLKEGMAVNNYTLDTLIHVYDKYYSRICYVDKRLKLVTWMTQVRGSDVDNTLMRDFFMKLISNENFDLNEKDLQDNKDSLYDLLFNSIEKNILFTNFQYDLQEDKKIKKQTENSVFEINKDVNKMIINYLHERLTEISVLESKVEIAKHISLILLFYNSLLAYKIVTVDDFVSTDFYFCVTNALKNLFTNLTRTLRSDIQIPDKIALLKEIQVIFSLKLCSFINKIVRSCVEEDCFHSINEILKKTIVDDEDQEMYDEDIELGLPGLRHQCVYFLASYCSYGHNYTDEIVKCILDADIYNFNHSYDVECIFRCINMVIQFDEQNQYLDLVFELLQTMCRMLFRNSEASLELLKILLKLVDVIWLRENDVMRQNCIIMVKGYLNRCVKLFYPPHVAVLVYECVARIVQLDCEDTMDLNTSFRHIIKERLTDNILSIRTYCCYLVKYICSDMNEQDVEDIAEYLKDIFVVNKCGDNETILFQVSSNNEDILKDERLNRTLSVLHSFNALIQLKESMLHYVVLKIISTQIEKSLSCRVVKRVLNTITDKTANKCFDDYINVNMKNVLYFWFHQGKSIDGFPFQLLGYNNVEDIFSKQMKWLVASEILWCKDGFIEKSDAIGYLVANGTKRMEDIIEMCFCSIIILCLPYIVIEKYKLEDQKSTSFKAELECSSRMFQSTRKILKNDKWSNLFVENMGELILLGASHLCDFKEARKEFSEKLSLRSPTYTYSKTPLVILNILFKLWGNVVTENVLEYKTLNVHSFLTFVEHIPIGFQSDRVLFSFVCMSITNAIKASQTERELDIFVSALKIVLDLLATRPSETISSLRKSVISRAMSILSSNNVVSATSSSRNLHHCFIEDRSGDVVDYIDLVMLKQNEDSLTVTNSCNVNNMCRNLKINGFSEECSNSLVHRIINVLWTVLKTETDEKIQIEACSCLAEIATYDLKTLVTVPPASTDRVQELTPRQYFTYITLWSLSSALFDENPNLDDINKEMIQPLAPSSCEIFAEYTIDSSKFDLYNRLDSWVPKNSEQHLQWIARITTSLLDVIAGANNFAAAVSAVCGLKPNVCVKILPSVLGIILETKTDIHMQVISEQINHFFKFIWDMTFDDKLENTEDGTGTRLTSKLNYNHKTIIHYVLNVVDFIRLQAKHYKARRTRSETLNYLHLDYNKVAWAAALADLNLVAIYYGELWASAENNNVPPASPDATTNLDGGCGTAHLTSEEEKRKHLINTGQFADALLLHDIALSSAAMDHELQYGAVTSLHRSGMHHLALQYIKSCPDHEHLNDVKYDCLSYLGDWSEFVDTRELAERSKLTTNINSATRMFRYACLKDCLNIVPVGEFKQKLDIPLNQAKQTIARLCRSLNMENSQCFYKIIANLHLFRDIDKYFAVRCEKALLTQLIDDWRIENLPPYKDFKHLEALISQRKLGLSNHRVQLAQRLVSMVKKFQTSKEIILLESKIAWHKGHKDIALSLLHENVVNQSQNVKLTAMSLRQYGLWMAECKRENARDIIEKYLEKSLNALGDREHVQTRLKVYFDIAKFADAEYKQVVAYMNSTTFENKVKCTENMKGTAASLKSSHNALTKDEKRALLANNAFRELDEAEIENTRAEKLNFLKLALRMQMAWGSCCRRYLRGKRCAEEHPHHTLPILFNLKNSDKDQKCRNPNRSSVTPTGQEPRVFAAASLVAQLASEGLDRVVSHMEQLCDDIGKPLPIPRTEGISKLQDLNTIPVPTDTVAIRKDCDYSRLATFASFNTYYELVGGINFPKKISCLSSDGRKRILLIKGEDDLRQDAVMQQVFNIVNTLLQNDPDITPTAARHRLKECHDNRKSNKHKLMVFNEILRVFRPVLHYFFTEHYGDPVTWYERRLAYTRSVATSSMVGYIMGLGDRHVQNILIDKTTAQVIHIDFGIAFDQGKTLPTPETIPFRLTQDIIAGFGCCGVEGIFRRCSEKTLQLLRDNQETLLAILEVLLCDPLYLWIVPNAAASSKS
ncbi:unnamed protein product, partial [Leptidea sinapis]